MLPMLPQWLGRAPSHSVNPGFMVLPIGVVFAACLLLLRWPGLQRLILKPGRHIGEIANAIYLLLFISGILALVFGVIFFVNPSAGH